MTHREFQVRVQQMCTARKLLWHASHQAIACHGKGLPDMIIAGPRGVIFAELKTPGAKLSPEQARWKHALLSSGAWHVVWTPADVVTGAVGNALDEIAA